VVDAASVPDAAQTVFIAFEVAEILANNSAIAAHLLAHTAARHAFNVREIAAALRVANAAKADTIPANTYKIASEAGAYTRPLLSSP
jgi:hypothetical protein